ncbi:TPA: 30S ribosomal protein S9 [archaeon]|jgi:small subunit ribosomal protein S9|uniref:30S ribosomal protein S9 n=1 Tax=Candidatus Undinarchaeum marinum TaxID=2756141 RepID=A0A832XFY6_9ARCH|nr:30S ribosomal protein S9 [Candidatus Undinarchaeum marinum]
MAKNADTGIISTGKKKTATARASFKEGKGNIRINSQPLEQWGSDYERGLIIEPLQIAQSYISNCDISINVAGGGRVGQAVATRTAIARGIYKWSKNNEKLRQAFLEYDNKLLAGDSRLKEACKPGRSKARARRQKSYR